MQKLLFLGPVLTASGYGEHARQLLRGIIESGKFDVSVCSIKWGQCSFLSDTDRFAQLIRDLVSKYEQEKEAGTQFDISVQVTIPNEFQKLAKVNIGVTAGIEVDRVSPEWIKKANEMVDLVVVPSQHSAHTFANVVYQDQKGGSLRLEKPMIIVPEGFESEIFNTDPIVGDENAVRLEAQFNFLSVGLGLDRAIEEDRKNISGLIKWFCQAFAGDERVGLVLKTNLVNSSLMDFEATKSRINNIKLSTGCGQFPHIQLVHGRLSKKELASLYRHPQIKAYITPTHGEGFGLPIIEAAACGLPVIATNWSGHLDFLSTPDGKKKFVPLEYDLKEIPQSAVWPGVMEKGTKWACVKEEDIKTKMKKVFLSNDKPKEWAMELASSLSRTHDARFLAGGFVNAIEQFLSQMGEGASNESSATGPAESKKKLYEQLKIEPQQKTLLFTMPMSAGDVFISTAIVDSLKKKHPDSLIIFATDSKYSSILKNNPNIYRVIQYDNWMQNVPFCEAIFSDVYTPNLAIQTVHANWIHGGKGRKLGEEMAAQCQVEFGEYFISTEKVEGLPEKYIAFHPGSGKGQWEARNYLYWNKVIKNLQKSTTLSIVQVGLEGDPSFEGCIDLRGKTNYNQLAGIVQNASCLVGIDSVTMHMAAAFGTPHVAIFGSSYSTSTGPVLPKTTEVFKALKNSVLLDTPNRLGCEKACYKYQCTVDRDSPCVNEINPRDILFNVVNLVSGAKEAILAVQNFEDVRPKISGYTHVFNAETHNFPYLESIKSMLGFCDEVIVVDGESSDDTVKKIKEIGDDRIKIYERKWSWEEPGMDGMQKAYGRAMASVGPDDFLWQQDADEVVHEDDYGKIKKLAERFTRGADLVHLPVVELWGSSNTVRTDRHSWKWRMSRNNFRVTHGINKNAKVFDEKTGKTYAKKGMSDGCEYVDIMTGEFIGHQGFYTKEIENVRQSNPLEYGRIMNDVFDQLPSVFHYSWADIPRKISNFKSFWNKCWSNLYNDPTPTDRFPDVHSDLDVLKSAEQLQKQGGEHGSAKVFVLRRTNPAIMKDWLERIGNDRGHLHNDQEQTGPSQEISAVPSGLHGQETIQTDDRP